MGYRNRFDYDGSSQKMGESAEQKFANLLESKEVLFREASLQEQYNHIDFVISPKDGISYGVDVKATKRTARHDSNLSSEKIWVEFQNEEGQLGWLYGQSKYIVFDKSDENGFYWIPLESLREFCQEHCIQGFASDAHDSLYKLYTKKGRNDVISQILFSDLKKLPYKFTPYT